MRLIDSALDPHIGHTFRLFSSHISPKKGHVGAFSRKMSEVRIKLEINTEGLAIFFKIHITS
jgi:hypothetical protein